MDVREVMDKVMEKAQPLLEKLSMVFGSKTTLTLIVQVEGKSGCIVLSPKDQPIANLVKSLHEAEAFGKDQPSEQQTI